MAIPSLHVSRTTWIMLLSADTSSTQRCSGFLYRATLASALNTARGRLSLRKLLTNWAAAAKLPFVYLGLAEDFWYEFDRYLDLEEGRPSTFFVIPFAGRPGQAAYTRKATCPLRGARGTTFLILQEDSAAGCRGLRDRPSRNRRLERQTKAREEAKRIRMCPLHERPSGVRMHWLYGDEKSQAVLRRRNLNMIRRGLQPDRRISCRNAQVFKPLRAKRCSSFHAYHGYRIVLP